MVVLHRHLTARAKCSDERGGVLVLTILVILPLLILTALVVDIGMARIVRRQTQNAADAAALAAAGALGDGESAITAMAVAGAYVTGNGFDGTLAVVNIPPVTGNRIGDATCAEVFVPATSPAFFAGVIDVEELSVSARAVACASGGGHGPYAIFGGSSTCQTTIQWAGSSNHVTGAVHSNGSIKVSGSESEVAGLVTYGTTANGFGDNTTLIPAEANPAQMPDALSYPVDFELVDYLPGGTRATEALVAGQYYNAGIADITMNWLTSHGLWNSTTKVLAPGLYVTAASINLSASAIQGHEVTLVALGSVQLSGSNHQLRPWDPGGLLVFSTYQKSTPLLNNNNCTSGAVKLSGSTNDWEGTIYAPFGEIQMSGASNITLNGSIIGLGVTLSGSELHIDSTLDADLEPASIQLIE